LVLLPRAFYPENAAASTNLGCVFLALGALLTPNLMAGLTRAVGFRRGLLVLALLCLTPAVCGMNVPARDFGAPPTGDPGEVIHSVGLWVAAGFLLFYQPLEEALGRVTRGSLKELNVSERLTALWLGLFWLTFLGTRLLTGWVIRPGVEGWLVFLLVILAAVMFGNLMGNDRPAGRGIGFAFTALCLAPVFPTVLGLALRAFPRAPGVACGTLMAGGSLGALLLPSLVHPASERHGPRTAMRLALAITLVLIGLALLLALVPPGR
jgi:fucose permease